MKKNKKVSPAPIREKLADALDMSKEIILDTSKITLIGNRELSVENYKAIVEYSPYNVKLCCNSNTLEICGQNLSINTMTKDFLYITGCILSVSFSEIGREIN